MSANLPINPNLEHLRNQAKTLLKACRAADPAALSRVRSTHPRFGSLSASEQRLSEIQLADMLLVIAREYGFASWARLKSHVEVIAKKTVVGDHEAASSITLPMRPPTTLHVTFIDQAGNAIPGIHVRVKMLYERRLGLIEIPAEMDRRWTQRTDAKGECVFYGLPQGMQVRFEIEEEAFANPDVRDAITLAMAPIQPKAVIWLLPGCIVRGRVVRAEDGKSLVGVRVSAGSTGMGVGGASTVTDIDGRYRLAHLRPGVYNIALSLEGDLQRQATARAIDLLRLEPGANLDGQDLVLIRGSRITGRVTDSNSGEGIADVSIGIYGPAHPQSSSEVQSAKTGSDGAYEARVPPGQHYVYVMGGPSDRYEISAQGVTVTLDDEATLRQDFTLTPISAQSRRPIRGRVVGSDGHPIPFAAITAKPSNPTTRAATSPSAVRDSIVEADDEGVFTLDPQTDSVGLLAQSHECSSEETIVAQSDDEVTLLLKPQRMIRLSGRILGAESEPLPYAKVTLIEWWQRRGVSRARTTTDEQGRFSFDALLPHLRYSISAEAFGHGRGQTRPAEHEPGKGVDLAPLQLPRADRSIAGQVVDERGDPVAKQAVRLSGISSHSQDAYTDADGRFRFEQVVDEPVTLWLHDHTGFTQNQRHVRAGDEEVILVRQPA